MKSKVSISGKRNMNIDMRQEVAASDRPGWWAWLEDRVLKEGEWKLRTGDRH